MNGRVARYPENTALIAGDMNSKRNRYRKAMLAEKTASSIQ